MNTLSLSLAAARAMLQMNVKSVAAAVRISDRTLTRIENDADINDPNTAELLQFYEDCGLSFQRDENSDIIGVVASPELRRVTLLFSGKPNPAERIKEIRHALRQIRGVVFKTYNTDKSTAAIEDTVELHIPVDARPLAITALLNLINNKADIDFIGLDGVRTALTPEQLHRLFNQSQ